MEWDMNCKPPGYHLRRESPQESAALLRLLRRPEEEYFSPYLHQFLHHEAVIKNLLFFREVRFSEPEILCLTAAYSL